MKKKKHSLSWKVQEEYLKKIKRYSKFGVMFYRTNDLIHSRRVEILLSEVVSSAKDLYPNLDIKKAKLIALHHDDFEVVLKGGDIPLQTKLMMNEEELSSLQKDELLAVDVISQYYPKRINGYLYREILTHAVFKDCMEAQLVSFVDKIDGYCEAVHEVLAGNIIFLEPIINYDLKSFNNLQENYPLIKNLFTSKHSFFQFPVVDLKDFFSDGKIGARPHTEENLNKKTFIPHYEMWKKITVEKIGIQPLINQVEFH
jgi:5'-deoxynucleotidase YfbR-like HD superfamily hydrolase